MRLCQRDLILTADIYVHWGEPVSFICNGDALKTFKSASGDLNILIGYTQWACPP
jgi:hypothetical protein